MRWLFVVDPPERLNPRKDSTVALMRAAARAGEEVFAAEIGGLGMDGGGATIAARRLNLHESDSAWMTASDAGQYRGEDFDAVWMRAEPPVDARFATATLILDAISRPVFNAPRALREWNEKLAIFRFPQLIPPTVVSAEFSVLRTFHSAHGGAVCKPLDGMGGRGVYVSPADDKNLRAVLEMIGGAGGWVMAQRYLPEARAGDARVFVIDGAPADWMLVRTPRADDHRGNMAAGGEARARPTDSAVRAIAAATGPTLAAAGILFAGLDVIGGRLTEINITCPTGLREVRDQTGDDLAETVLAAARARLS
ncbi:MAG: glutathione synthase [Gammaproteobacteria bacterium]